MKNFYCEEEDIKNRITYFLEKMGCIYDQKDVELIFEYCMRDSDDGFLSDSDIVTYIALYAMNRTFRKREFV